MSDMDDVVSEFLVESHENLDRLDSDLVALEENPTERAKLASIFRTIHTIKGTCGFLGFGRLEKVAHVGENLLSKLRDGELLLDAEITSGLLAMVDAVRRMLADIEAQGREGDESYAALIELLTTLATGARVAATPVAQAAPGAQPAGSIGEVLLENGSVSQAQIQAALEKQEAGDLRRVGEILVEQGAVTPQQVKEALSSQNGGRAGVADSSIRVDVGLLDKLMTLVGELVLARNQILQHSVQVEDNAFTATSQRLNLITTELQESVMKTRMQPIGNIWGKFPRVVRDLAVMCGKEARIEMQGKETELDKTIIEAIKDPMTHIVRNSIDHGIEAPDERVARGKPREGLLFLRAYHEGGQVNIEVSDDGQGIDVERVKRKALEKGLIGADQAARMSDREAINLIFAPGFSTAQKISNVSGRGVGMDVVRTNIEKIGGQVDLQNHPGKGTTIKIKIPLTLAIIPALMVSTGGQRFAIPQVSLLELVRLENEGGRSAIEHIHGTPVYRLRGSLLPLLYLDRELAIATPDAAEPEALNIVVLQADGRPFGLVVDSINDTEEIVVKPLAKQLKGIPVFAGATILGDGRVALILDVLGLAQRAHVLAEIHDRALGDAGDAAGRSDDDRERLLVFAIGEHGRLAMPLSMVARLEEFAPDQLELSDGQEVVQYRGQILPLVRVAHFFGRESTIQPGQTLQAVVYTENERSIGLLVDRILDIVEERLVLQRKVARAGLLGSAVIQQRITDIVDARSLIASADPNFFEALQTA